MQLGGSKEGGWGYTQLDRETKMEIPAEVAISRSDSECGKLRIHGCIFKAT